MSDSCHHAEFQKGWYPTIDREYYDWDIFIDYANANIESNPRIFYSLLKKIKKDKKDSPYLLIKKNIDWFIAATDLSINSIKLRKYNYLKKENIKRNINEEGRAGCILLENKQKETVKIPIFDYNNYRNRKELELNSSFLRFNVYSSSPNNDEEYIFRSFFIDIFKFGCPRIITISDLGVNSRKTFHNPDDCTWAESRREILGTSPVNMQCYTCDHQYFNYVLNKLTEGKDFSEIEGFQNLLSNLPIEERYLVLENIDDKKTKLGWARYARVYDNIGRYNFPGILLGAATDSLIYFLAESDRRRLKKCPICANFFIADKDLKRRFCYPPKDCERTAKRNRQRELMRRKRDKDGPGFDPRYV